MNTRKLMEQYKSSNPKFREKIESMLGKRSWICEGYDSPEGQRGLSIEFVWGHNHNFGDWEIKGLMGDRHLDILQWAIDHGMNTDLAGKNVVDIGAWTGGMSLLLSAMGEPNLEVYEEVVKYAHAIESLREEFCLGNMRVFPVSFYENDIAHSTVDLVNLCGVLYHISDIPVFLKQVANIMKIGAQLVIETGIAPGKGMHMLYAGPSKNAKTNWNWFFPTQECLNQMLNDVGIYVDEIEVGKGGRAKLIAVKREEKPIMWCGLSRRV